MNELRNPFPEGMSSNTHFPKGTINLLNVPQTVTHDASTMMQAQSTKSQCNFIKTGHNLLTSSKTFHLIYAALYRFHQLEAEIKDRKEKRHTVKTWDHVQHIKNNNNNSMLTCIYYNLTGVPPITLTEAILKPTKKLFFSFGNQLRSRCT